MAALLLGLAAVSAHAAPCQSTTALHVASDGDAVADGSSWAQSATLHRALAIANADTSHTTGAPKCFELRLKQGVYKPTTLAAGADGPTIAAARKVSFRVDRPMVIRGGYTGNGVVRVIDPSNTVLSGDIDGDDRVDAHGITQKAVLTLPFSGVPPTDRDDIYGNNSFALLNLAGWDGVAGTYTDVGPFSSDPADANFTLVQALTLTAASSFTLIDVANNDESAALLCVVRHAGGRCGPDLHNVHVVGNASFWGAVSVRGAGTLPTLGSGPLIRDSVFRHNFGGYTGALFVGSTGSTVATTTIQNSRFEGNGAIGFAGAICATSSGPEVVLNISDSHFEANASKDPHFASTRMAAGAMGLYAETGPVKASVSQSTFVANDGWFGGAIAVHGGYGGASNGGGLELSRVTFERNTALHGGALSFQGKHQSTIVNATFQGNAVAASGDLGADLPNPPNVGGAIYQFGDSAATSTLGIDHAAFSGNTAAVDGSAIANVFNTSHGGTVTMASSIVWGNSVNGSAASPAQVVRYTRTGSDPAVRVDVPEARAPSQITDSIVQDGGSFAGSNILTADPRLQPLADNGGPTKTMRLGAGSAAIDVLAGASVSVDQRGLPRPAGLLTDMGPLEVQTVSLTVSVPTAFAAAGATKGGSVTASGSSPSSGSVANCGASDGAAGTCTANYAEGAEVTLTTTPVAGYRLRAWTGACTGSAATCTLTLSSNQTVTATFQRYTDVAEPDPGAGDIRVTLSDSTCALVSGPLFTATPVDAPDGYTYPFGAIGFTASGCVSGATTRVTLELPAGTVLPTGTQFFKRIGTSIEPWSASISGRQVTFTVTDSTDLSQALATGDSDPTPEAISDPMLIAVPRLAAGAPGGAVGIPTLSQWGVLMLSLLAAGAGALMLRRRAGKPGF